MLHLLELVFAHSTRLIIWTVSVRRYQNAEMRLFSSWLSKTGFLLFQENAVANCGEAAQVFDAYVVLLDPGNDDWSNQAIRAKKSMQRLKRRVAEHGWLQSLKMEDNPYMQERAADIRDVTKRPCAP